MLSIGGIRLRLGIGIGVLGEHAGVKEAVAEVAMRLVVGDGPLLLGQAAGRSFVLALAHCDGGDGGGDGLEGGGTGGVQVVVAEARHGGQLVKINVVGISSGQSPMLSLALTPWSVHLGSR